MAEGWVGVSTCIVILTEMWYKTVGIFPRDHRDYRRSTFEVKFIIELQMSKNTQEPRCKKLVLDAGPLLSLSPLRGLAQTYLTVPQVLAELKDNRAREHFERLGLMSGVKVEIRSPDAASLSHGV